MIGDRPDSVSEVESNSFISSQSPGSRAKSKIAIEFPSSSTIDQNLPNFYRIYSELIRERLSLVIPGLIIELRQIGFDFKQKEVETLYNIHNQSKQFFAMLANHRHKSNLKELLRNDSKYTDCMIVDNISANETLVPRDKSKVNKTLFEKYAFGQMNYLSSLQESILTSKQV